MSNRVEKLACDDQKLQRLLRSELSDFESQCMERHLETCSSCQRRLESLAAARRWWSGLPQFFSPQPPLDILDEQATGDSSQRLINKYLQPSKSTGSLGRFGEYDIEEIIGAGAMGVVLKARDASLDRRVAIKVLSPHYADSEPARRRFERESYSVAAVVHPNVVPIHAVNAAHELPYLVMAYVSGESLHQRLKRCGPLEMNDVLRIGMQTAQGLSAAHSQGIVHRDVKPANILLEDGLERVLLSDFGLARAIDDATMTRSGMLAGTPEYMSPEQARGDLVDHRSDLFSLGCVMYAMCTSQSPFRADSTMAVLKRICETEPADIRSINDEIPVWLQGVIEKLLKKLPDQRYQSASIVARLLQQCLAHAQQPTALPLPREVSHGLTGRETRNRNPASDRRQWLWTSTGIVALMCLGFLASSVMRNRSKTVSPPSTTLTGHMAPVYTLAFNPNGSTLATAGDDHSVILWNSATGKREATLEVDSTGARCIAFNVDGSLLAAACHDHSIRLWDEATGVAHRKLEGHDAPVSGVAFGPDGTMLASCGDDQTINLWDLASGTVRATLEGHIGAVWAVAFSPRGSIVASGSDDMRIRLWEVSTGEQIGGMKWHHGPVRSIVFNSDGSILASGSHDTTIKLWDVATALEVSDESKSLIRTLSGHTEPVASVAFSPNNETLASASWDGTIKLWDVSRGEEITMIDAHADYVWSVSFNHDGNRLASAGRDHLVKIWDLREFRL